MQTSILSSLVNRFSFSMPRWIWLVKNFRKQSLQKAEL